MNEMFSQSFGASQTLSCDRVRYIIRSPVHSQVAGLIVFFGR